MDFSLNEDQLLVGSLAREFATREAAATIKECDETACFNRDFLKKIEGAPVTVDQWQLEKLALVTTRAEVLYYAPGLPREFHSALWGKPCASAEEAVKALTEGLERNARIAVIPEGPYVLARLGSGTPRKAAA